MMLFTYTGQIYALRTIIFGFVIWGCYCSLRNRDGIMTTAPLQDTAT